jgi:hypothetical protein
MKTYHALEFEDTFEQAHRGARKVRFSDIPQTNWRLPMKNRTERSTDEVIQATLCIPERGRPESLKRRT